MYHIWLVVYFNPMTQGFCLQSENFVGQGFINAVQPGSQNLLAAIISGEQPFPIRGQPSLPTARNKATFSEAGANNKANALSYLP